MNSKILFILSFMLFFLACDDEKKSDNYTCLWLEDTRPVEMAQLGCPDDHAALAGDPPSSALPANKSTMFAIERNKENKIHFFDSQKWRHFSFATEKLEGYPDLSAFNSEMYYSQKRRLYLGTVTRFLSSEIYALEIAPIDKASPEMIEETYNLVKKAFLWDADLRYHPTSNALEMESRLPKNVPIVYTKELYEGAEFQGLNLGKTIGKVVFLNLTDLDSTYISRTDIVVLDRVPNDISACAGIITAEFQTPLSHVNLLSINRGTPNMAYTKALEDESIRALEGKWAELVVSSDGFTIKASTKEAGEKFWEGARPPDIQKPEIDLTVKEILNVDDVSIDSIPYAGGKASHYGELRKLKATIPVEKAFVIPISFYVDFIKENKLDEKISAMLKDKNFQNDGIYRKTALAELRDLIKEAPLNPDFEQLVKDKIDIEYPDQTVRLRSSSNAEDLESFNGAGLYESKSYKPGDPVKTLANTIRTVWSSLWSMAAFEEREWARVDHDSTGMALLFHRSYPDEIEMANGVAITANPFDPPPGGQAAYYVNVQKGAISVANPEPGVTPDSFLYYKPPAGQGEMTYLSFSSETDGTTVMEFNEIVTLVKALYTLHNHFHKIYRSEPFGMDVEFKLIDNDRKLIIKQARPYPFRKVM
ncbi:MAG TPA: PEP/pyruvate-binding domain-containing protein [bacterium]|nr:PEP/pyruvate-binding domain-containing protein [bacterium]